ncbi:hypothetical protein ACN6MT_12015 [Neobacillus niacini]|uniref:hypothetical protein n=1 Tax=Neobacillus niacini TaxID=86668 RepID=UPI003B01C61C
MQTIIWAIGAMLLLLLIISFLSLDFNLKGKFAVVLAAFVIALGGLAAVNLFPLWQTWLILFVLTFFAAYIMDSRLGKFLYKSILPEDELIEEINLTFSNKQSVKNTELDLLDLEEMELTAPTSISISASQSSMQPESSHVLEDKSEEIDLSFLQDLDTENHVLDHNDDPEIVDGYLSEIENMLLEDSQEKSEPVEDSWLDELADFDDLSVEENELKNNNKNEDQLDDGELELLVAFKETAAGLDKEKINLSKVPELQK